MMTLPQEHKGFTLVETLVAITILTVAIVGPMYTIRSSLLTSYTARDKMIATSLAQESIEHIRARRDDNYLYTTVNGVGSRDWNYSLDNLSCYSTSAGNANYCTTDSSQDNIVPCIGQCGKLSISPNKLYTQQSVGTTTTFTRRVQMYEATPNEIRITVIVDWTTNTQPYSVTVTGVIYNWL
jgi:prepilin-type N-terminal cleavage/methylation domain-containing protein